MCLACRALPAIEALTEKQGLQIQTIPLKESKREGHGVTFHLALPKDISRSSSVPFLAQMTGQQTSCCSQF